MSRSIICFSLFVILVVSAGYTSAQDLPVKEFGSFMRVRSDGEHASGYTVDLWTHGTKIIGIIRIHRGLMGDPPAGLLENVLYDPRTRALSFSARASLGLFFDSTHNNVPSKDVFTFRGTVTKQRLRGVLSSKNLLCKDQCGERHSIDLQRSGDWTSLNDFTSLKAWNDDTKVILDRYGPKW